MQTPPLLPPPTAEPAATITTTTYCTPNTTTCPPCPYPYPLPLVKMDIETKRKMEATVAEILNTPNLDLDTLTERHVREKAASKLGVSLDGLPHKILVRHLVESFLLASVEEEEKEGGGERVESVVNGGGTEEVMVKGSVVVGPKEKVICKLSNKREVAVKGSGEKAVVSIRELFLKDGKSFPTHKCISLSGNQWSNFRKSFPAIEEAITKMESKPRADLERKLADDTQNRLELANKPNGNVRTRFVPKAYMHHGPAPEYLAAPKKVENLASAPHRLVPTEIIRLNGKNYQQWANRMDSYLSHLKVAYVLSDPCPSAAGVMDREIGQVIAAMERWADDDHICRQNILNSLCDNLYGHYSKKYGTAKDLWEELKLAYLFEEHGAKASLVKKYIEFQMVDEKPVFEQVEELHHIADSLIAAGLYVEEKFHVNVIISKLPPSWKPISVELMKEDYVPVWMLMNRIKAVEEPGLKESDGETLLPTPSAPVFQPTKKLGPQRIPMKRQGVPIVNREPDRERNSRYCTICKKKGHLPEQCWFRKPEGKDMTSGELNADSCNAIET